MTILKYLVEEELTRSGSVWLYRMELGDITRMQTLVH